MATSDLLAHAASDIDFYALLSVAPSASPSDIRRAYRKTALKYHPDKLGAAFDAELFQRLQIANDVLSDEAARAAYDARWSAKVQKVRQEKLFEGRRREMKEELEARERGEGRSRETGGKRQRDDAGEMEEEIRKLAEEGKRRRMEMQSQMAEAEAKSRPSPTPTPNLGVHTPPLVVEQREVKREMTPQTAQEEAEEEAKVARLEMRIREIREEKERRRKERKARKSGVLPQSETPSASPRPEAIPSNGDFERRKLGGEGIKLDTPRRPLDDMKSATPASSPKFSFSPRPRTGPTGGNDGFEDMRRRLKEAEKRRLEEEIRRREAEGEGAGGL